MSDASIISRFHACEGSIELLALEGQGALELLQSNPLAGFCLAVNWQMRPPPSLYPLTAAWRMVYQPQKEILGWLGFPGTEAVAKIGRKCVPESLTLDRGLALRRALADEATRRMLAHVPRVNAGVITFTLERDLHPHLTPGLLIEVAQAHSEDVRAVSAQLVRDIHNMAQLLRLKQVPDKFHSCHRLRRVHDELTHQLNQRESTRKRAQGFPPPPLADQRTESISIFAVTDAEQLRQLGRAQHNCVASYTEQIQSGRTYVYRVESADEVCTLALHRTPAGQWEFQQLRGICNRAASAAISRAVHAWLAAGQTPESKRTMAVNGRDPFISTNDLPPVPVAGLAAGDRQIVPVTRSEVLAELSLMVYSRQIARGWAYAYQVNAPEGICSTVIRRGKGRFWRLDRVRPSGAHAVRGETVQAIGDWLGRSQARFR